MNTLPQVGDLTGSDGRGAEGANVPSGLLASGGFPDAAAEVSGSTFVLPHPAPVEPTPPIDIPAEIAAGVEFLRARADVAEFALIGSAMYRADAADVDFAVMLHEGNEAMEALTALCDSALGFEPCGQYDTQLGEWGSVRRGNLNLMVTHSRKFFDGYKTAMEVCKVLDLADKFDRIAVCAIVRDGRSASDVRPWLPPTAPVSTPKTLGQMKQRN